MQKVTLEDLSVRPKASDAGSKCLKIDIVVHGRFHAFHLARALIAAGQDVRLLTNYPRWAVRRFDFPAEYVRSFWPHGILSRIFNRAPNALRFAAIDALLHRLFGIWAARSVRKDADLIYIFSSVAEETLQKFAGVDSPRVWLVRGSSHIRVQSKILSEEQERAGVAIDKPKRWTIAREEREYALAKKIVTLSAFAKASFLSSGVPANKVIHLASAVDVARFRPQPEKIQQRQRRITTEVKLRVLMTGSFTLRKGAIDYAEVARELYQSMEFRCVGDLPGETSGIRESCQHVVEFIGRVPETQLKEHYDWADLYVLPTLEDGFPAVLAQACAAGLLAMTTPNSSGPDFVVHGENGWILPTRDPKAFIEQLRWCNSHREEVAAMSLVVYQNFAPRDWSSMANELIKLIGQ